MSHGWNTDGTRMKKRSQRDALADCPQPVPCTSTWLLLVFDPWFSRGSILALRPDDAPGFLRAGDLASQLAGDPHDLLDQVGIAPGVLAVRQKRIVLHADAHVPAQDDGRRQHLPLLGRV